MSLLSSSIYNKLEILELTLKNMISCKHRHEGCHSNRNLTLRLSYFWCIKCWQIVIGKYAKIHSIIVYIFKTFNRTLHPEAAFPKCSARSLLCQAPTFSLIYPHQLHMGTQIWSCHKSGYLENSCFKIDEREAKLFKIRARSSKKIPCRNIKGFASLL